MCIVEGRKTMTNESIRYNLKNTHSLLQQSFHFYLRSEIIRMKNLLFTVLFFTISFFAFGQFKEIVSPLKIESRILDQANLLTVKQRESIFFLIQDLEKKVGSQMAVQTITSLNGQLIN